MDDNDLFKFDNKQERMFALATHEMLTEIEVLLAYLGFIHALSDRLNPAEVAYLVKPWLK